MTITIHQAICGEQNKAWKLLKTTLSDNSIAKKIAFQADLQDRPSGGLQWLPAVRGFLLEDYFLLIKTYPDNSPDVRNGRVFSHCLIIDKTDIQHVFDMSPLINSFKSQVDKKIQLKPIIFDVDKQKTVALNDSLQLRFNKIIQSFINFSISPEPVVWVGQGDFEISVCKFWQLLSPLQKESFHFGINFNPSEVVKNKLSFVVIPENAERKFSDQDFIIVGKGDAVELKELPEQFLGGESNAVSRIESFVLAIEATKPSIKDIQLINKGINTFENFEKIDDIKLLNTLSNIVAKFSPSAGKGTSFKAKLLERICLLAEKTDESHIFLLRNFEIKSFKDSEKKISTSIKKWASNYLFNEKQSQKLDYVPFIIKISEAPQDNWLIQLISQNIANFLSKINEKNAKIIWRWIDSDAKIFKIISNKIESTKSAEKILYKSFFKLNKTTLSEIKSFSLKRKWFRLYATILKSQFAFEKAIKEQIKVDSKENHFEGIKIITQGVKPKDIINFSIANGDKRLILLSGEFCKTTPKFLAGINIENVNWQKVWLAAINNGNKFFDGIKEPQKMSYLLFDLLINEKPIDDSLVEKISETDFANILNYPNRNKLWSKLPSKVKVRFLKKTSSTFLYELSNNSTYPVPSDAELSNYIMSDAISDFLYYNSSSIKNVLPIFNTYSQLSERTLNNYISNYSKRIDVVDATQLGQLVYRREYNKVAATIFEKARSNKSFKQALKECYSIFGFFKRNAAAVFLGLSDMSISKDEWWDTFIKASYTLYEEGPAHNKIWTQAEGEDFDLLTKGTGKEVWIAALKKLRKKNCSGDITVKKLLKVMYEENKKNEELKTLKDLWNKI